MTPQERAVIEAARKLRADEAAYDHDSGLFAAVDALDAAPAEQEILWSQVVEGDQLKSIKNGKFYEVQSVRPGVLNRKGEIRINLLGTDGNDLTIYRKSDAEPLAIVRRGATGKAMDTFIDVFSSGG